MAEDTRSTPKAADERETLAGFLEYVRATLRSKVRGVSDADARRPMVPSGTSLAGLVKHLAYVERWWFRIVWAGEDVDDPYRDDPDGDFRLEQGESLASVIALYERECAESRRILAAAPSLDVLAQHPKYPVSLRWVGWHLVEETARHNGHADIVRELLDGTTGM
jgi:uncharacterized damage-inducible protein DinB